MPGTTRYSATFDRPYEEDELGPGSGPGPPVVRRQRSQSLQVDSLTSNSRRFSAFLPPSENGFEGQSKAAENIPTRTAGKSAVKGHSNPFQFVKVGTSPLFRKADEQLKKAQQVKKPEPVKEENEEEWQSNLDSWKSRRRKMSEGVLRRQEEIKELEKEHESLSSQQQTKKTKTFSEMMESRAHRGRAVSLCLFNNPLESGDWVFEKGKLRSNRNNSYDALEPSEESAESSNINSEDDNEQYNKQQTKDNENNIVKSHKTNGHHPKSNEILNSHAFPNSEAQNSNGGYIDSGLESLSSGHRTGDIPDSGSDFSQDSGSSIDCDSPRVSGLITTGIELLEEFSCKDGLDNADSNHQKTPAKAENLTTLNNQNLSRIQEVTTDLNQEKQENVLQKSDALLNGQSPPKEFSSGCKVDEENCGDKFSLIAEVSVDKVAEEMERLILEQLEEEERAKEMALNCPAVLNFSKSDVEILPRLVQPPKEKPPPPPSFSTNDTQKIGPVKRVNSTKRILREIHKRRSDFLGIETSDEELLNEETSIPPPPALEDILRDEREHDRLNRQQIMATVSSVQDTMLKEDEIAQKEREIIERLEEEEQRKLNDAMTEEGRIQQLKMERQKLEQEKLEAEQRIRLEEARLLQKREAEVQKQEGDGTMCDTLSSPGSNTDSVSTTGATCETSDVGETVNSASVVKVAKLKVAPPAPPKPLKRKEALRKERERLRLEQEALMQEREEHRRKIQLEQEQMKKVLPKNHVPEAPISRVGPPIPAKPTLPPQLITTPSSKHVTLQSREDDSSDCTLVGPKRNMVAAPSRKIYGSTSRSKASTSPVKSQKVPCVRKQSDVPSESRYNENHWLIQEAEMRRIAEQTERQRNQTHNNTNIQYHTSPLHANDYSQSIANVRRPMTLPIAQTGASKPTNYAVPMQLYSPEHYSYGRQFVPSGVQCVNDRSRNFDSPPAKPMRTPVEKQEQMLSVSGRKRCSHCGEELGRGAAMIIESLQLYYHIQCFLCCVCQAQLGNGSCGTDVRVRNNKLHCHNCYSNDEAGLKFSQV